MIHQNCPNQNIFWNKIPWFLHQYTAPCVSYRPSKQSAAATVDILESSGLFSYVLVQRPLDKYDTVCGVFLCLVACADLSEDDQNVFIF